MKRDSLDALRPCVDPIDIAHYRALEERWARSRLWFAVAMLMFLVLMALVVLSLEP